MEYVIGFLLGFFVAFLFERLSNFSREFALLKSGHDNLKRDFMLLRKEVREHDEWVKTIDEGVKEMMSKKDA